MTATAQLHRAAPAHRVQRRSTAILAVWLVMSTTACAGGTMKGSYSQASVQPVAVEQSGDGAVVIRFTTPPESMFYAGGVSYETHDGLLRVAIDRCRIRDECRTMVKSEMRAGEGWTTRVRVPFEGDRIVLVHADGEQQIYP